MTCTPPRTTTPAHRNAKSAAKTRRCGAAAADGDRWPLAAGEPPPPPLPAATVTLQLPSLLSFLSFADIAIAGAGHNRRSRSGSSPDPQAAAAASLTGHTIRNALQGVVEHRRPANISTVGCRGRGRRRSEAKRSGGRRIRSGGCVRKEAVLCRPTPAAAVPAGQPARLYPRPRL